MEYRYRKDRVDTTKHELIQRSGNEISSLSRSYQGDDFRSEICSVQALYIFADQLPRIVIVPKCLYKQTSIGSHLPVLLKSYPKDRKHFVAGDWCYGQFFKMPFGMMTLIGLVSLFPAFTRFFVSPS